ncbi:MAG: phage baseplate assembly protein V [Acidimicrobiia bacterium]|nr:phage baseplate assembly protein V [Acidimicrobiia bacterium]
MQRELRGLYQGTVVKSRHDLGELKIKVKVPDVLGACAVWARSRHPGLYRTPSKGDGVWVEFQNGDIDQPVWSGEFKARPDQNQLDLGDRMEPDKVILIVTPGGQKVRLSDRIGDESITLEVKGGAKIELTRQTITLQVGTAKIELKAAGNEVDINSGALNVR